MKLLSQTLLSAAILAGLASGASASDTRHVSYEYNNFGQVTQIDGPRTDVSDITQFSYDDRGHLTSVTNALGHTTQLQDFTALGSPQRVVDANGVTTELTYNVRGWLTSSSTAGATTQYVYDAIGQVTQITLPSGASLSYEYDNAGRLTAVSNSQGERIEYTLDAMGNRTQQVLKSSTGELVQTQSQVFDELGRLIRSVGAAGQTSKVSYDVNSNTTGAVDANNHGSSYGFDALNRLVSSTDALNQVTKLDYDAQGNLAKVSAPNGAVTQYEYNGFGELFKRISADTGVTTYQYDSAGNITQKTDARGEVTQYRYDALNRLTERTYPSQPKLNVTYQYDETDSGNVGIGRLTGVKDQAGLIAYYYNAQGNLTSVMRGMYVAGHELVYNTQYQYSNAGYITGITYPSGASVSYARNSLGQVTAINFSHSGSDDAISVAQNISYLPFGPVQSLTWGNGLTLNRQYDQDFQLTSQSVQGIQSLSYGYDAVGNILSIDDGLQASLNQKFEYDALDHLALESGYFGQKTYQFDEVGNRTQRVWTTKADASGNSQTKKQVLSYHDNSNRLNKLDNQTVSLDAMGNTLASRGANATYDTRGRLSSMTVNGELRAKYTYNAIGERVVKERILGGQSYYGVYQYDLAGQLLAEANYSSTRKLLDRHYVWLGSMPVAMVEVHYQGNGKVANTQVSYIHADHLNTPRRATNTKGNIVWAWYSDAYGVGQVADNPDGDGQTVTLNLRFPGQYYDAESGLFYNYFRDYDPSTGRYIESDPIGLSGGLNTFAYVEGNPANYVDPFGLQLTTVDSWCGQNPKACAAAMRGAKAGARQKTGTKAIPSDSQCDNDDDDECQSNISRQSAMEMAYAFAGISPGSDDAVAMPWSEYRPPAGLGRGTKEFAETMQNLYTSGASNYGHYLPNGAKVVEHPQGHPDQTGPGHPEHHKCPHFHARLPNGYERIFEYKPGT
ncbi:RHS repeat protein [Zooshikella ganghwensis]|uniref:RHS repeat protein n=1 Tax=Zooshikella ganghwensis TaxID=202772 RepID=UPI001BAE6F5F|nr:RHS repeat protein [Zooshikella ganghwensis]